MSHNTLIDKIKQDAGAEVAKLKEATANRMAEIKAEADKKIATLAETSVIELKKKHERMELIAVSRARQQGRIAVQQARRDQIDGLFASVKKDLVGLSADAYVATFAKYAKEIVPAGVNVVRVEASSQRTDETAKILGELGLSGQVESSDNIKAGFILHASDGVYDVTLDRIMSEKRADLEMLIVEKIS